MLFRSPLAAAAGFLAAGLLAPPPSPASCTLWGAVAAAGLTAGAAAALGLEGRASRRRSRLWPVPLLIPLSFFPVGRLAAGASEMAVRPDDLRGLLLARGDELEEAPWFLGRLRSPPVRVSPPGSGCRLEIRVTAVELRGGDTSASGVAAITLPAPPAGVDDPCRLLPGCRVRVAARLRLPASFGNPGSLDRRSFLASRGIAATGRAPSARLLEVLAPPGIPQRWLSRLRRSWRDRLESAFHLAGMSIDAGTAVALAVGDRSGILPERARALREAGTAHLLALSGFHVALVAGILFLALGACTRRRALRLAAAAGGLALYLSFAGGMPPVRRAVNAALLALGGRLAGRTPDGITVVGAVFVAVAVRAPARIHDASLQLSFVAAAALVLRAARLAGRLRGPAWVTFPLAANAVALMAVTPLGAALFNRVTPGALVANLVASPLMGWGFVASLMIPPATLLPRLLATLGVDIHPDLGPGTLLAASAAWAFRGATWISAAVASLPGASYLVVTPRWPTVFLATALGGLAGSRGLGRRARLVSVAASALLTLVIALPLEAPRGRRAGIMAATFLDVGQGSSTLIETPGGKRLLVDAGGFARSSFDVGELVVGRALLSMGIRRVDAVAISHEDFDHAGGVPAILRGFPGSEIWIGAGGGHRRFVEETIQLGRERGRVIRLLGEGSSFRFGGAMVRAFNPRRHPETDSPNERSLVLELRAGGRSILMTGDIGFTTEERISRNLNRVDLLQVAHHGSGGSTSSAFAAAVRPRWAVISCGRRNRYGHPKPDVLRRLGATRARLLRTDTHGAIRVELDPSCFGSQAATWDGGRWKRNSAHQLDRIGDEAGHKKGCSDRRHQAAHVGEPPRLVHQPGMSRAEEDEQRRPEKPGLVHHQPQHNEPGQGDPGEPDMNPRGDRVGDVPAVQLTHRKEVQRGGEKADPASENDAGACQHEAALRGSRIEEQGLHHPDEERVAEAEGLGPLHGCGEARIGHPG